MAAGDSTDDMTFGELIRHLRTSQDLGVNELSRRTGLAVSHIQYIEKWIKKPGDVTIRKLAHGLRVSPEWLIAEKKRRKAIQLLEELGVTRRVAYLLTSVQPLAVYEETRIAAVLQEIHESRGERYGRPKS